MNDSKKLPVIEVGDTVVFRTDLVVGKYYNHLSFKRSMVKHLGQSRTVQQLSDASAFYIGDGFWYSFEMVAEVIKPSKARVYSESDMRKAIEMAQSVKFKTYQIRSHERLYTTDQIIKSLNTEGK